MPMLNFEMMPIFKALKWRESAYRKAILKKILAWKSLKMRKTETELEFPGSVQIFFRFLYFKSFLTWGVTSSMLPNFFQNLSAEYIFAYKNTINSTFL